MPALPKPPSKIPDLVWAAYVDRNEDWDGLGFSPSMLGEECDRALWYWVRWAPAKEAFLGRMLRLFQTGHREEERIINDLRMAGLEVHDVDPDTGDQFKARALAGHVRGKLDGICRGVPEAPVKWHVLECKSHNLKSFKALRAAGPGGLRKAKFEHWVQCQIYMHIRGIERALYAAVCKDNDDLWFDRVEYDAAWCAKTLARLENILRSPTAPLRISNDPAFFGCRFCRAKPLCHGQSFARLNCRTCLHSTPDFSGDAAWTCARWVKPLTLEEQKEACPAHLYLPDLVPGEQLDADEEAETVTYRLADGRMWVDGRDLAAAPEVNPEAEEAADG
jgi:hypothetical protein